ncbi:MAG: nuclear transport factor 2 family protein [Terracidiphilus sp.]
MTVTISSAIATNRSAIALKRILILFVVTLCAAMPSHSQQSDNEKAVWKLESSYWEDVKALDLDSYKALWHENFVGWPYVSSQPVRKDHITDWITAHTDKGARLQWFSLVPAASQSTGDMVVTHYWLTAFWADKAGHGEPDTTRVTHTWIKTAKGWQIISGMSASIAAN